MSKKLDMFYIDKLGNFRATLHVLSSFNVPVGFVHYDPEKAKLIITDPIGSATEYDVGAPYWENDTTLATLERKT